MLTVAQAQAIVLTHARPLPAEVLSLGPAVLGQVLAEDVASDLDMPPWDKSLMDGYAVRAADLASGQATLDVIEEVMAGQVPRRSVGPGQATRIMTGAPLPAGADAVVMVEHTRLGSSNRVEIDNCVLKPGQNVLPRGREMREGEIVLRAGTVLRPQELGLLASVGRTAARLIPRPRVAVLSTGDEVVEAPEAPGPGQIRNGNGPMLTAQARRAGAAVQYLGIARDRLDSLRPLVAQGLNADVLVLSGGVSAGKLDLVPGVLAEQGVTAHFHRVEMKPGKPVLFGTRSSLIATGEHSVERLVFGLPGNPVSALVCFELFVRPALRQMAGRAAGPRLVEARLREDFPYRTDRPTYHPARLELDEAGWVVQPVPWFGSPDLKAIAQANAFVLLPAGDHRHRAGERFGVLAPEEV